MKLSLEPGVDFGSRFELRRATHLFLQQFPEQIESFKFNVGVAKVAELVNALRKAIDGKPGPKDPAVREEVETVAKALSLFAPYTAEDMWQALGHKPAVALAGFAKSIPELLVQTSLTAVVEKQDLGDIHSPGGNATKTENGCDQGDDQKNDGVVQHAWLLVW